MKPPVTPKPMPASSPDLPTDHTSKLFGIVYITLTGVVDTIVPAAGLWSWVGKSASYLLKLAPLLCWALPAKTLAQVTPRNSRPAAQDWVPDMPLIKFVVFALAPALVVIWTNSPDLWSCISYKFNHVRSNPTQFMHILEDFPGRAQEILITSENVVRSLTCDDLEFSALKSVPLTPPGPALPVPLSSGTRWFLSNKKVWAPKSMLSSASPSCLVE
ncbi:hypothetical protein DSO57_1012869 [Entomophthora muscae]|uniref:Uncharacterized protein n=1 Tax=Entomophthora muscae TaxID=34485 RepID=A0ACC2TTY9_9FUNG|nr:hypothetical protein DSO57_1012869 [Entomophthora muscae]